MCRSAQSGSAIDRASESNFFIERRMGKWLTRSSLLMRTKANNVYLMIFSQTAEKDGAWLSDVVGRVALDNKKPRSRVDRAGRFTAPESGGRSFALNLLDLNLPGLHTH